MKRTIICLWCNSQFSERPKTGICPQCGYNHFKEVNMVISSDEYQGVVLKMGNKDTLQCMRDGSIWFQSPKYYQDYKGNQVIGDINECAYDYIIDIPVDKNRELLPLKIGETIEYRGQQLKILDITTSKLCVYSNTQNYNRLLCFYLLRSKDGVLEDRSDLLKNFGTHFCLVDINKLSNLIINYAGKNDINCTNTTVKYTSKNYSGAYNPTCKDDSYAYQHEFRFILRSEKINELPEKEPLKVNFGSDIMQEIMSEPQPLDDLFKINTMEELFKLFGIE